MLLFLAAIEDQEVRSELEELYNIYNQEMFKRAYYILKDENDAEDAVQEAFIRIWRHLDKLHDLESDRIKWYMICVAKSAAIDIYRKKKDRWEKEELVDESFWHAYSDEILTENNQIYAAIAGFPDRERDVLMLKYVYGFSYKEMAQMLGVSTETVKKALMRGKDRLERLCREEGLYND